MVIHPERSDSLYFLGFGASEDRGTKGYLAAIKACEPLSTDYIFSRTHYRREGVVGVNSRGPGLKKGP